MPTLEEHLSSIMSEEDKTTYLAELAKLQSGEITAREMWSNLRDAGVKTSSTPDPAPGVTVTK